MDTGRDTGTQSPFLFDVVAAPHTQPEQFSEASLWRHWAALRAEDDANDIGVDLVAQKHDGSYCAIQYKCYAEDTRISKPHLDSFIAASASEIFTSRLFVNTGGELGENARRTIEPLGDKFRIIRFTDLENSPFNWPDLSIQEPEQLIYQQRRFSLKDHQQEAFDDVMNGFKTNARGKLIMASGTGKTFTAIKLHAAATIFSQRGGCSAKEIAETLDIPLNSVYHFAKQSEWEQTLNTLHYSGDRAFKSEKRRDALRDSGDLVARPRALP